MTEQTMETGRAPPQGNLLGSLFFQDRIKRYGQFYFTMEVKHLKVSNYKTYDELPLFLNAEMVAQVLGVSPSTGYELMHKKDFPILKIGNRMVVPKEKFIAWVSAHVQGGDANG